LLQPTDGVSKKIALSSEIPAMIGGRLLGRIRNQRYLVGVDCIDQGEEVFTGISLDVELGLGVFRSHEFGELKYIVAAYVPLVRPRVNRYATRTRIKHQARNARDARPRQVTAVPQLRNGVEIDR
jgi:hypothetical protein